MGKSFALMSGILYAGTYVLPILCWLEIFVLRYVDLLSPSASVYTAMDVINAWDVLCTYLWYAYLCISADFPSYLASIWFQLIEPLFLFSHKKVEMLSYRTHTENITVTKQYFILLALSLTKALQFIYWLLKTNTRFYCIRS